MNIWEAIAEKFQNVSLQVEYADEDWGSNCGKIKIDKGELTHEKINTKEFSFKVLGFTQEEIAEYTDDDGGKAAPKGGVI